MIKRWLNANVGAQLVPKSNFRYRILDADIDQFMFQFPGNIILSSFTTISVN